MKYILADNPEHPFNLIKFSLPYNSLRPDNTVHEFGRYDSEEEMIQGVIERNRELGLIGDLWHIVDEEDIPEDETFFDAWVWDGEQGVKVDMERAKELGLT
jgi:hypothetical protein